MRTTDGKISLKNCLAALAFAGLFLIVSCGGGGGDSGTPVSSSGTLKVSMTDAATTDYKAVYVTIKEVAVHKEGDEEGGFTIISTPNKTYDLLELVNGKQEVLGLKDLATGHYTQLRLILDSVKPDGHPYANYFIDASDNAVELKVPSGLKTGIKLVNGFDLVGGQVTLLLLDFDAARSIVKAGKSGKYILKPTIKVLQTLTTCTIEGNAGQEGVLVSAQVTSADSVTVAASTVSDSTGAFKMVVDAGTYTIVAYKDGYVVYSAPVKVAADTPGKTYNVTSFTLKSVDDAPALGKGTLSGTVTLTSTEPSPSVTISIRQKAGVAAAEGATPALEVIEVKSINVADDPDNDDDGTYTTMLPVLPAPDKYSAYVTSTGLTAKTIADIAITKGATTTLNIAMP